MTTLTPSINHTTDFNITTLTPSINHTTDFNITTVTPSINHTTEFNMTTVTPSPNDTTEFNMTTVTPSPNDTTAHNATTGSTVTPTNHTTASPNNTTVENITTTTVTQNKTATDNQTTAPMKETQQNTTAPSKNMTTSTTARLNTATTSTKNSTVDNATSVVDNVTKPTVAPLNNQTGNHTTATMTNNITTANTNDNLTTAASAVSTTINLNQTAGISLNLSSTASSFTTDFLLTTNTAGVNLTTTGTSVEATTSNTTTTTITTHGPVLDEVNTTTSKVPLASTTTTVQTSTLTNTASTKPETAFTTTLETTTSQEAQENQADQLLNQTRDASSLNSSQVTEVVEDLENLLDGPISKELGQKTVNIISNLMESNSVALSASANRLVRLVDNLGLNLLVAGDREILSSGSLVLAVREVDGTNFPVTSVDIFNTDNVQLRALSRSRSKRSGSALGSVSLPSSLTNGLSVEQQKEANRVQFAFYTKPVLFQDAALDKETLVSPVLAASVANLSISNLTENIQFTIRNINPVNENYTASCAFWHLTQNGGVGHWSSAGCFVVNASPEETTCSCNHLTSFAILLDLSREVLLDPQQAQILTFITYIGCGISAIFLAFTLLTYLLFDKLLRDIPAKILVQLCLSLLLLNLVFLLDGWLALYPAIGLCISTAFFLHYFLLTSFTWAGLEALHMYLSIVRVFTPYLSRYMLKFSLLGWGIPLLVVIVVIAVDKDNYGLVTYGKYTDGTSNDFCWLRNDIAFYVGVVAYFLLIFSLCLLVFIVVMIQLSRIKKQNPQNQPPNRGVMTDLRSIAGLIILLGLTWGFALFAWGPLYIPFVYLFTIFNSLQGFLVFIFHCAVKESVRREWRTYLCCGKLRLPENSEWSRTTQINNRFSVVTASTSVPHVTSRSSSVMSEGTSGSDSVFMDSGISDGSNSDAVLNEIHRRNLAL
ncbi:adhesion G-protein coupled receptor G2 isoform X2 [Cebidichthys violaceus]|uniref:adhesion G-protein coupled receptor G2 isoform X2 n=1 Tax=Cebidichthys violaceus TaxID=271503 RepID=UPI0035C9FBB8